MKNIGRKKIPPSTNKLFLMFIFIITLFMAIGYASVNSISFDIGG